MELYTIALKELGIDNKTINLLLSNLEHSDFNNIFKGKYIEIQFKHNLDLNKYSSKLSNISLLSNSITKAKSIIKKSKACKIKFILITDKNYPINLKTIEDPPPILYYKGRGFFKKHEKSIACVGTRVPTDFSYIAINALIPKLVEEEFTIVSGLAEGVDVYSHTICLKHNGTAIAVLAHGLDIIYPKSHANIANEILSKNGLLISEYPVGTSPDKFRFVERNRIVSGLAKSIIVFETKEKSGTMHTVNYATKQKKPIFCPLPSKITPLTAQLHNLIEHEVALPLTNRSSYDTVVYGSGYKIKKDKNKANKYKSNVLYSTLNALEPNNSDIYSLIGSNNSKKQVSFNIDEDLYVGLSKFLTNKKINKKELFNAFILTLLTNEKNK